jgi:hypothetical protein
MSEEAPVEPTAEIIPAPANLLQIQPVEMLRQAWVIAQPLTKMITQSHLSVAIQGRKFVKVEGWTALGSMLGVFPVVVWTRRIDVVGPTGEDGWEACVEARTMAGAVVGRAEAMCSRSERTWSSRDDYALRAMAQTRATSRALRGPLGFVMAMGGFEATAAEEMPHDE